MIGPGLVYGAIAAIAAIIAAILGVAWAEFGHVRHARTWAISFGLLALAASGEALRARTAPAPGLIVLCAGGMLAAINAIGFRQRAGLPAHGAPLLLAAIVPALATLVLAARDPSGGYAAPFCLFSAIMCGLAFATLRGRRRSERLADRAAQTLLLAGAAGSLATFADSLARSMGAPLLPTDVLLLAGPALVTAVGLFAIFLIAADLADKVRRLARTDMLTGLLNRRGFEEAAMAMLADDPGGRGMALLTIDIDRFKMVNDCFGHPVGDHVLTIVASCLLRSVSGRDLVARMGGEEFAILLADADAGMARASAEALRAAVAALGFGGDAPSRITASFGVTPLDPADRSLATLFDRADRALYRAKEGGRNRVAFAPLVLAIAGFSLLTIDVDLIPRAIGAS